MKLRIHMVVASHRATRLTEDEKIVTKLTNHGFRVLEKSLWVAH